MADAEKNTETETSEENNVLNVFIAGADTGTGLILTGELVKAGHKVVGAVINGSEGAFAVRKRGAIPAYADLTRSGEVRSALQMAKADIVVNLLPTLLNGVPHTQVDSDALLTMLDTSADAIMEAAGKMGVKRVISTSFAFLYQDGENVDESAGLNSSADFYKRAAEVESSVRDGGVPAIILRTGYVYGGYSPAFKDLADEMVAGRAVPAGDKPAAWIHDNDLASAIFHLVTQVSEEDEAVETIYNVASDLTATPDTFINTVSQALGLGDATYMSPLTVRSRITPGQKTLMSGGVTLDTTKLKTATDWQPQINDLDTGLDRAMLVWRAASAGDTTPITKPERAVIEY